METGIQFHYAISIPELIHLRKKRRTLRYNTLIKKEAPRVFLSGYHNRSHIFGGQRDGVVYIIYTGNG